MEKYPGKFFQFASGSLVWGYMEKYVITTVPPEIREEYINSYFSNWKSEYTSDFKKIVDYLETVPYDEELMHKMLKDVKSRDLYRGTSLLDFAPEWKPYYEQHTVY